MNNTYIDPEAIRREARAEALQPIRVIRDGIVEIGLNNIDQEKLLAELTATLSAESAQDDGKAEDESLQETLDRMDGYGIDNECGARG